MVEIKEIYLWLSVLFSIFIILKFIRMLYKFKPKHNKPLYIIYQDIADVDNLYSLLLLAKFLKVSPKCPMRLILMPRLVNLSIPPFDSKREHFNPSLLYPGTRSTDSLRDSQLVFKDAATRVWLYLHTGLGHDRKTLLHTMDCIRIYRGDYPMGAFGETSLAAINHAMHAHDYVFHRADIFGGAYGDVITVNDYNKWLDQLRNSNNMCEDIHKMIGKGFELFELRAGATIDDSIIELSELNTEISIRGFEDRQLILVLLAQATSLIKLLAVRKHLKKVECIYAQYFTLSHSDNILGEQFNIVLDRKAAEICIDFVENYKIPFYCVTTQYPSNGMAPLEFMSRLEERSGTSSEFFALRKLWNGIKGGKSQLIFDIWVVALICNTHLFSLTQVCVNHSGNQFIITNDLTKKSKIFIVKESSVKNSCLLVDWMERSIL